jgi:hypothetical protein
MNVDTRHLRVFVEVAHRKSFRAAADSSSPGQPGVDQAIARPESALGVKLFPPSQYRCAPLICVNAIIHDRRTVYSVTSKPAKGGCDAFVLARRSNRGPRRCLPCRSSEPDAR